MTSNVPVENVQMRLAFNNLGYLAALTSYNGEVVDISVSTWLGHGVPRYLVRHYSNISVRGFLDEVNFCTCRLVIQITLPNMGELHAIS